MLQSGPIADLANGSGWGEIAQLLRVSPSLLLLAFVYVGLGCYAALSLLDRAPPATTGARWARRIAAALLLSLGLVAGQRLALITLPLAPTLLPSVGMLAVAALLGFAACLVLALWLDQRGHSLGYYAATGLPLALALGAAQHVQLHALRQAGAEHDGERLLLAWLIALGAAVLTSLLASYLRRRRSGSPLFLTLAASLVLAGGTIAHHLASVAALQGDIELAASVGDAQPLLLGLGLTGIALLIAAVFATGQRNRLEQETATGGQIRREARADPATGLPTTEVLAESFLRVQRLAVVNHGAVAVAVMQLHGLERVQSTQGTEERDRLLSLAAWRLRTIRRDEELLGAMGDGRMVLVLRVVDAADASSRLREACALFETPLQDEEVQLRLRPAAGISLWPAHGDLFSRLLANALVALERCPPGGVQLFHVTQREENERRLLVESTLSSAIAQGELSLAFQPIADARSNQVRVVELLARWNSSELGNVPPKQFILIAEASGVIGEFDRWLVREAIATTKWLDAAGFIDIRVALNCSPVNLCDKTFLDFFERTVLDSGIDTGRLEVEVTEAALAEGDRAIVESLLRLRELGVGLTIDDFGIGHSSLARLRDLPVDALKIDQSFVRDMDHPQGEFLVSGILGLAHGLGKIVIAEGVETEAQRAFLADLGCEYLQGFLISRPLSWRGLLDFLGEPGAASDADTASAA